MAEKSLKENLGQIETTLEDYLVKKAPALPTNIKEIIVKIAPYLAIVGVVISLPAVLALLGLTGLVAVFSPLGGAAGVSSGFGYTLSTIILIAVIVLEALSIPGLMGRKKTGWDYSFYSVMVSAVSSVFSGAIVSAVFGLLVGLYLLFQVKEYYK